LRPTYRLHGPIVPQGGLLRACANCGSLARPPYYSFYFLEHLH
jgi:hypothetical protein